MNIKIKSLSPTKLYEKSLENDYLYKDLRLDLTPEVYLNNQLNKKETLNDISASNNLNAIKNSILHAFFTSPGDKILNPTYGIDIRQYLFEPIDEFIIDIIKDDIETKLPIMEPRIEVEDVIVYGDEDQQTIYIQLQINVPSLNIVGVGIKLELNSSGYTIL